MALSFDGMDDHVRILHRPALQISSQFTLECWTRTPAAFTPSTLMAKWDEDSNQRGWKISFGELGIADHLCVAFSRDGTATQQLQWDTGLTFVPNTWYHIAVTHDALLSADNVKVYVNGSLGARTTWANAVFPTTAHVLLGGYDGSGNGLNGGANSRWYGGQMDEVRLWSLVRSPADLTQGMRLRLTGQEPGLVTCYHFDEVSGVPAYDASANHLDGTLVNRPRRVPSYWPLVTPNGPNPMTNECHAPLVDPGATVNTGSAAIAAAGDRSLALRADGAVACWGAVGDGTCGHPYCDFFSPSNANHGVVAIAAGDLFGLALKDDGAVVAWNTWRYGVPSALVIPANDGNRVVAIAAGGSTDWR